MKLGSLFGRPKTLAKVPTKPAAQPPAATAQNMQAQLAAKPKPGQFNIIWPKAQPQKMKDYKAILTLADLEAYLQRCFETKLCSFDWETAASEDERQRFATWLQDWGQRKAAVQAVYDVSSDGDEIKELNKQLAALEAEHKERLDAFLKSPLDPWRGEICTASLSAAPHEARVVPISHKKGKVFEPQLSRDEARKLFMDTLDRMIFRNDQVMKIAVNLSFETKYATKYAKYILMPAADPLVMWVRVLQVAAPQKIKDPKKPASGWGLKPATKNIFGVEMNDFQKLLAKHGVQFFDEIDASQGDGLVYSAEDSDYGLQHYLYWDEVAKQITLPEDCPNKNYSEWLHNIEMPFSRVIGLMEYWGMAWNKELAEQRRQEAENAQEAAAERIKQIARDTFGIEINPGKTGKTGDVKHVLFDLMKVPAAKWGKTGASLDEEALIDMRFMLENKLVSLDEEEYLAVELPPGWENIDPDKDPNLDKATRGAVRIAQRQEHPYKDAALALIAEMDKIQKYTTLLSSHIVGRQRYLNEISGRIHAGYSPWTETARLNSFNPNGQNVPRLDNDAFRIRSFYIPGPGKIMFFIDFSGFELRIMAWKSGDPVMIEIFRTGGDMHRKTAAELTGKPEEEVTKVERTDAKPANFGIAYGGTEHSLQKTYKTDYGMRKTLDYCAKVVNAVKTAYNHIPKYQREIVLQAREQGWVNTIYGYIRMLPHINSANRYDRGSDERRAGNTPIQGTAADVMKKCQNQVYDKIGQDSAVYFERKAAYAGLYNSEAELMADLTLVHGHTDMIAQIHDEIIFEMDDDPYVVERAKDFIKGIMEQPPIPDFPVPVEAEPSVGYSWGDKMDVNKWLEQKRA